MVVIGLIIILVTAASTGARLSPGIWETFETQGLHFYSQSLFKGSNIYISIFCHTLKRVSVQIKWVVRLSPCGDEYVNLSQDLSRHHHYSARIQHSAMPYDKNTFLKNRIYFSCLRISHFQVPSPEFEKQMQGQDNKGMEDKSVTMKGRTETSGAGMTNGSITAIKSEGLEEEIPFMTVWEDGYYLLIMDFMRADGTEIPSDMTMQVTVKMRYGKNFLSAEDWPSFIFHLVMIQVYIVYGIFWLIMQARNQGNLHQVHSWIAVMIFLGLLENAVICWVFNSLNNTGQTSSVFTMFSELLCCLRRAFAQILVIVCSFGVVRSGLLKKILILGLVYFFMDFFVVYLIIYKNSPGELPPTVMFVVFTKIVLMCVIWLWTGKQLVGMWRMLSKKGNKERLHGYTIFSATLILWLGASVVYRVWALNFMMSFCRTDWKRQWMTQAGWHVMFAIIQLVIMLVWRPSADEQRYIPVPLLDGVESESDLKREEKDGISCSIKKQIAQIQGWPKVLPMIDIH